MPPVLGGRFELCGLEKGKGYPVYFLDAKRRLGATVTVQAGDEPRVVLKPCGTAIARYVNLQGTPRIGPRPDLHMIVTPGEPNFVPSLA